MPEFHPTFIPRRQRLREVRDCLGSAQVPPRRFFSLYLGLVTVIDLVSVGVQLLGGDTPLLEDLPSLFAVVLSNLLVQLLLVGTLLYGLAVWRGQRAEYATLGDGFSFAGRCIAVLLLQLLIVGSGLTLMVLPGIYFFYVYRFALFELCEDPGIGPVEAMRRARIHAYGYKRQLFAMDLRFLPWILLSRLPAIYQDLVYLLPAYARTYGLNWTLSLPAIPLSPLGQTAVFDLFHLAVALLYLPAFTVAQASYYDTARETNPIPQPPRLPEE